MSEFLFDPEDDALEEGAEHGFFEAEGEEVDASAFFVAKDAEIVGHEENIRHLEYLASSGKMPHALLFCGTKGIGKALVAEACARMLLAGSGRMEVKNDHPIVAQMQAGSLAEYLYISGAAKVEEGKDKATLIDIEQIRAIGQKLALTRASCPWRVIIIDGAEDMNANAANALLKNLEEPPPKTVFILISHHAARLLPTIRSRCRTLQFKPLGLEKCIQVMQMHQSGEVEELRAMAILANASPGLAIEWMQLQGAELYAAFVGLMGASLSEHEELQKIEVFLEQALGDRSTIHRSFRVLSGLILAFVARASQTHVEPISEMEGTAITRFRSHFKAEQWPNLWFDLNEQFSIAQGLHLDYKSTLTPMLVRLSRGKEPLHLKPF